MRSVRFATCLLGGVALGLAACTQTPPAPRPAATQPELPPEVVAHNATQIELATDPSAECLQTIGSALQLYYHVYGGMPPTLEQAAVLWKGQKHGDLALAPPGSAPYVYVARGLAPPGELLRLVVYEPASHDGWRWGLVMTPPPQGMTTVTADVKYLSDKVLGIYLQSAAKPE